MALWTFAGRFATRFAAGAGAGGGARFGCVRAGGAPLAAGLRAAGFFLAGGGGARGSLGGFQRREEGLDERLYSRARVRRRCRDLLLTRVCRYSTPS